MNVHNVSGIAWQDFLGKWHWTEVIAYCCHKKPWRYGVPHPLFSVIVARDTWRLICIGSVNVCEGAFWILLVMQMLQKWLAEKLSALQ